MTNWLFNIFRGARAETHDERVNRISHLVHRVVPELGDIMEDSPLVIFPVSKLPLPREDMKIALQLAWGSTQDPKLREFVAIAYQQLAQFRDDVKEPIDPTLPDDATPYEVRQILDPYLAISTKVQVESAKLIAEFREFERLSLSRAAR
jgi:hypothetical protein